MARYEVRNGSFGPAGTCELIDAVAGLKAVVVPSVGSNLISLRNENLGARILHEPASYSELVDEPTAYGYPVLMPPNRIRSARFEVDGRAYVFPVNRDDYHIHGLVHNVEWQVVRHTSSDGEGAVLETVMDSARHLSVSSVFPQHFVLKMKYVVRDGGLHIDCSCENLSDLPLPFGVGFHPYFRTPMTANGSKGSCCLRLQARERWVLQNCFPTGQKVRPAGSFDLNEFTSVAALRLDDLYGDVANQAAVIEDRGSGLRLIVEADEAYPFWVVWTGKTPDAPFVCLEPYSCVTNAFNLDMDFSQTGARLLKRGEVFSGKMKVSLETISREK